MLKAVTGSNHAGRQQLTNTRDAHKAKRLMCAKGGAARVPMDHRMTPARSTLAPPTLQVTANPQ